MFLKSDPIADGCNVLTLTVSSLEFLSEEWHDYGTSQFKLMQRYRITIPLVAIRLCTSSDSEKPGMLVSLPEDAMVEVGGRSPVGQGMLEVSWQSERYAVFQLDLESRATLELQD